MRLVIFLISILPAAVLGATDSVSNATLFPPVSSQWRFFGPGSGNDIMFINRQHRSKGHVFVWTERYNSYVLADAIHERIGVSLNIIFRYINPVPNLPQPSLERFGTSAAAIRNAANKIIDANPLMIGGSTYRASGRQEKWLKEIDCASNRMRNVETIDVHGELNNLAAHHAAPWFSPETDRGNLVLMRYICKK